MQSKTKLIRVTTVPESLNKLLEGQLRFMSQHYDVTAISSNKISLEKVGEKEGVSTHVIEMTRKITPIKDVVALYRLYRFLKEQNPKIVHTHTPKAGIIGMLASRLAKVPVRLHTVAGLPLLVEVGVKRKILNFVEKLTYKCATKVYPNSFGLKAIIEKEGFTKTSKLKVIGNGSSNGIDTNFFDKNNINAEVTKSLKQELSISEDDFTFIFVGRIVGDKGINELVEAFDNLSKQHKNVKLLLVGPFEEELDPVKNSTNKIINTNKNIITTGFQKDVRPYFAIANMLVFPSYREGFPNVVMQASAMEIPAMVSDINGCNEIITHKTNGFIIPVKQVKPIFDVMAFVINNKEEAYKMGLKSRANIIDNYSQKYIWAEILKEYKKL